MCPCVLACIVAADREQSCFARLCQRSFVDSRVSGLANGGEFLPRISIVARPPDDSVVRAIAIRPVPGRVHRDFVDQITRRSNSCIAHRTIEECEAAPVEPVIVRPRISGAGNSALILLAELNQQIVMYRRFRQSRVGAVRIPLNYLGPPRLTLVSAVPENYIGVIYVVGPLLITQQTIPVLRFHHGGILVITLV